MVDCQIIPFAPPSRSLPPGAEISRCGPVCEKYDRVSDGPSAPTDITPSISAAYAAGYSTGLPSSYEFPIAMATNAPLPTAYASASRITDEGSGPPRLRL